MTRPCVQVSAELNACENPPAFRLTPVPDRTGRNPVTFSVCTEHLKEFVQLYQDRPAVTIHTVGVAE